MNKRIKLLVSAVLAAVMVCLCIPFTASAAATSATFSFASLTGTGADLSGSEELVSILNACDATSSAYITAATASKVYNGNANGGQFPNTAGLLKFGTSSKNGVLTLTLNANVTKVEIVCHAWNGSASDTIKVNECDAVAMSTTGTCKTETFEIAATNVIEITAAKRAFVTSITVYFDAAGGTVCEHTYTDCEDTTCDKGCGNTRTAPGHEYDNCVDTTCNNCSNGNRTALAHEYTNEYDAVCDKCPETRTVTLPAKNSTLDITTANKVGEAQGHDNFTKDKYYVTGKITEIVSEQYGNCYIEDASGKSLYIYGLYSWEGTTRYDSLDEKPAVGDEITVYGIIGYYSDKAQMKNAWIYVEVQNCTHEYTNDYDATCNKCANGNREVTLPAADSVLGFDTAELVGLAQGHNSYTAGKYYIVGTIKEITNAEYGNLVIEDENGNTFVVYGSYDATGDKRFDKMDKTLKVGDKVTVYGALGQYSGTAQIKNGWLSTGSSNTGDSTFAYVALAVVAIFGIAFVSKKH